jgi:hypothetical protein
MPNFTTGGYIKKLEKMAKDIDIKPFYEVTNEIIARQENRIFNKGIDGNGRKIASYSTKPMLATKQQFPRVSKFKPTIAKSNIGYAVNIKTKKTKTVKVSGNKNDKSNWLWIKFPKAKKAVPVMLIEGGYGEFKKIIGKGGSGGVNLWLFGHFRKAFANSANPVKMIEKGFNITYSIKSSVFNPQGKLDGLFKKYPQAFKFTKGEKAYVLKRFREIFINHMRA